MDRNWLKKVGSIEQMAYIRKVEYKSGRADGLKAYQVKAGQLMFTVAEDKCMDITELSWQGINLNFLSKPGLQNRQPYDYAGFDGQRSIMGGMFFTCGTDNVGTPVISEKNPLPMHGSLRSTPAGHVCTDCFWSGEDYKIHLSGEMRQASLFGDNIVLRRSIDTYLGSNRICIHDEYENQGYGDSPFMLLYHFNIGYPLLDEDVRIDIMSDKTVLRGEKEATGKSWYQMTKPEDLCGEEVFYHEMTKDGEGYTSASIYNPHIDTGLRLRFRPEQLPRFAQWKSAASGDYVIGFEPCNCHVNGLEWERENGTLPILKAGEKKSVDIELSIITK